MQYLKAVVLLLIVLALVFVLHRDANENVEAEAQILLIANEVVLVFGYLLPDRVHRGQVERLQRVDQVKDAEL